MQPIASLIHLIIALPKVDHTAYVAAVGMLRQVMGRKAPDVPKLIQHTLRCRDGRGLAEDYLESIHWPVKPMRAPQRRPRDRGRKDAQPLHDELES